MVTAVSVLVCALSILGSREANMPPIKLIDTAPPEVSAGAEAFVDHATGTIYLITSSRVFREAAESRNCEISDATRKLASILAHEEWHVRHGVDEKGAYETQLITLIRLGLGPNSGTYHVVQKSMLQVLERKRHRPQQLLAQGRNEVRK